MGPASDEPQFSMSERLYTAAVCLFERGETEDFVLNTLYNSNDFSSKSLSENQVLRIFASACSRLRSFASDKLPVQIDAAMIHVSVSDDFKKSGAGLSVPGRCYTIEAIDREGKRERIPRVRSLKFEADAQGCGTISMTYYDYDPTKVPRAISSND